MSAVAKIVQLPIEPILGTRPQKFRWKHRVDSRMVECEGVLPISVEASIIELIALTKYTIASLADARKDLEATRQLLVEAQERVTALEAQQIPQPQSTPSKKDKK